jgi:DNA sulfur modification protein DndC
MLNRAHTRAINLIQKEYRKSDAPWIVGYSGGKDSSALLKLLFLALLDIKDYIRPMSVIYCDTGVEIPIVRSLARTTLNGLKKEAKAYGLPISTRMLSPNLNNRFFVKVIGRGYPPPSNKFRWCTDRLRIEPVQRELGRHGLERGVVLLGLRRGESPERDRTLGKYGSRRTHYFRQAGNSRTSIFSPILELSVLDVWTLLRLDIAPKSIAGYKLEMLYQYSSGECPIIRDPRGTPCGKGRFGCWTCTVVRKDHAVENLVRYGYDELQPLLEFRNWMAQIRDKKQYRCRYRRNGSRALGPFTLDARREILGHLRAAQRQSSLTLITRPELRRIHQLWNEDKSSDRYSE